MKRSDRREAFHILVAGLMASLLGVLATGCSTPGAVDQGGNGTGNANQNTSTNGNLGGGAVPETLSGTVEVGDFTIPAGTQVAVAGDLDLIASGKVTIDGDLIADDNPNGAGYSISITADGDITVDGTIQSGAPADALSAAAHRAHVASRKAGKTIQASTTDVPGQGGGSLNLITEHGNLTITFNSTLIAFSGTDAVGGVKGAPGGRGGGISLCASFGKLTVRGAFSIGNGGNGGDATIDSETLEDTFPNSAVLNIYEFTNAGGNSGRLHAFATSYDWPHIEFYGNEVPGLGRLFALDPISYTADPNTGTVVGGLGGAAGGVLVMDDVGQKLFDRLEQERTGTASEEFTEKFKITAAPGGRGWMLGGIGGLVLISAARWNERDGVSFQGIGGAGGAVTTLHDPESLCGNGIPAIGGLGGTGGSASLTSPSGIPPLTAREDGDGGDGGTAIARGGEGGQAETDVNQTGGTGGFANCVAGSGADGLSSCFAGDVGSGGNGGAASAFGGKGGDGMNRGEGGLANAIAGVGGKGGDGDAAAGSGGAGGAGFAKLGSEGSTGQASEITATGAEFEEDGPDGEPGRVNYFTAPDVCAEVDYLCPDGQLCGA